MVILFSITKGPGVGFAWSNLFSLVPYINVVFGINLNYTNAPGFYRKLIFSDIHLQRLGFLYETEILVKAIRRGYLFAEVLCSLGKWISGASQTLALRSLLNAMRTYLKLFKSVCSGDNGSTYSRVS